MWHRKAEEGHDFTINVSDTLKNNKVYRLNMEVDNATKCATNQELEGAIKQSEISLETTTSWLPSTKRHLIKYEVVDAAVEKEAKLFTKK